MADGAPVSPRRRPPRGLKPLRAAQRGSQAADADMEERLQGAWTLVVGTVLAKRTRLVRVRRGILVIGVWDLGSVQALRQAAAAAWPEVRARLRRFTGVDLAGVEVEPCDPPAPAAPGDGQARDALVALFGLLRTPTVLR